MKGKLENAEDEREKKYSAMDANLAKLQRKLRDGSALETGERGMKQYFFVKLISYYYQIHLDVCFYYCLFQLTLRRIFLNKQKTEPFLILSKIVHD